MVNVVNYLRRTYGTAFYGSTLGIAMPPHVVLVGGNSTILVHS